MLIFEGVLQMMILDCDSTMKRKCLDNGEFQQCLRFVTCYHSP